MRVLRIHVNQLLKIPRRSPVPHPISEAFANLGIDDLGLVADDSQPSTSTQADESVTTGRSSPLNINGRQDSNVRPRTPPRERDSRQPRQPLTSSTQNNVPDIFARGPSTSPVSVDLYLQDFHALRWIAVDKGTPQSNPDLTTIREGLPRVEVPAESPPSRRSLDEKVKLYLDDLDKYLAEKTSFKIKIIYRNCPSKTPIDIERALAGLFRSELDARDILSWKEKFFRAIKSIFLIFLPLDQSGTHCSKFWGAVYQIIVVSPIPYDKNTEKPIH